jgi:hypothetical protein
MRSMYTKNMYRYKQVLETLLSLPAVYIQNISDPTAPDGPGPVCPDQPITIALHPFLTPASYHPRIMKR